MTATAEKAFETKPFYQITDEAVFDERVLNVAAKLLPPPDISLLDSHQQAEANRRSSRRLHPFSNVDQRGCDGDDFSGFVAKADIDTADGRELTVIDSWYAANETGIPRYNSSWSAEFDDRSVAEDFWGNFWTPVFNGMDFVESARIYLDEHPDLPRRTIRIQELGLLNSWHDQRFDEHVLLEKFSTIRSELVRTPKRYENDPEFEAGRVYIVPVKNEFGIVLDHVARTCLAAFVVEGGEHLGYTGWRTVPDQTFVQWSNGRLEAYFRPITSERGPVPLEPGDLSKTE